MSLAAITQLVRDKLRTAALGADMADQLVVERAIGLAVEQYSADAPQQLSALVTGFSGETIDLPSAWVLGRSVLDAVEYPVGQAPRAEIASAVVRSADEQWRVLLLNATLSGATLRVWFTAPHVVDADTCTVPAQHLNAVACWAAAELCRQIATQKGHERDASLSAVAVQGSSQSGDLARRARDWFTQYRVALGIADPEADDGGKAAGTVVTLERTRTRARFHSLGH